MFSKIGFLIQKFEISPNLFNKIFKYYARIKDNSNIEHRFNFNTRQVKTR